MRTLLTPRMLALHAFAVAAITAMVILGLWQLGHYGERQEMSVKEREEQSAVPIDAVLGPDAAFSAEADGRTVTATGTYAEPQFLVAGDDGPAPWLVTPLETGNDAAVLVVRGRSTQLRPAPAGEVTVTGTLLPSQARTEDPDPTDDVRPSLSTSRLVADVRTDLYSGYVVLDEQQPAAPDDLERVVPPAPDPSFTAGIRNLMYALQWWAFAAFAVFMWWRISREEIRRGAAADAQVA